MLCLAKQSIATVIAIARVVLAVTELTP
jgi:hypothetical protein